MKTKMKGALIVLISIQLLVSMSVYAQDPWSMTKEDREAYFAKIREASEADHKKMLELLGITTLRPGANGRDPAAPNAANYDEAKANPYPVLPDPLLLNNGKKVTDARTWWQIRRLELIQLFDRHVYGIQPAHTPAVKWEVVDTQSDSIGEFPVSRKTLIGHVDNTSFPDISVDINVTLVLPADSQQRVPVIIALSYNFPPGAGPPRTPEPGPDWKTQLIDKGWGYAEYVPTSVQADNGAGLKGGIIGLMNKGKLREADDWGALKAWAWGASRILDYLATDPSVDHRKVGITGHSRYGKAAAVAMAYDQRFAIGYISSSGEGGLKLNRRNAGEIVENVAASSEYHWMAGNFIKYAGPLTWKDLPVDAHELIALCAPRPIFIGCGSTGDEWTDPKGMFMAAVAAGPVYRLLGKKDLGIREFPPVETNVTTGEIAFRQHSGGHTPVPNWPAFISFASRYFD